MNNKTSGFSALEILILTPLTIIFISMLFKLIYVFGVQEDGKETALKANKLARMATKYIEYKYYYLTDNIQQGSYAIIDSGELFKYFSKVMVPMYGYIPCILVKKDNYYIEPYLFFVKPDNSQVIMFKQNVIVEAIRNLGLSSGYYYNGVVYGSGGRWHIDNVPSLNSCNGTITNYSPVISLSLFTEGLNKNFRDIIPKQNALVSSRVLGSNLGDRNDYNTMKASWYMYKTAFGNGGNTNFTPYKIVFNTNNNLGIRSTHEDEESHAIFINDNRVVRVETSSNDGKNVKIANFVAGTFRPNRKQLQGDRCTKDEIGQMASGIVVDNRITGLLICSYNPILCRVNNYDTTETCWLDTYAYSIKYHVHSKYFKCPKGFYLDMHSFRVDPIRPTRSPDSGCDYDRSKTEVGYRKEDIIDYRGVAVILGVYGKTYWWEHPNGSIPWAWCNWDGYSENGGMITEATCTNDSTAFIYLGN